MKKTNEQKRDRTFFDLFAHMIHS